MMRIRFTVADLRDEVHEAISGSIEIHRNSRLGNEDNYQVPIGAPTENEVTDFILTNQMLDPETILLLTDDDEIEFADHWISVRAEWFMAYREHVTEWAETNTWLGADLLDLNIMSAPPKPDESLIWNPKTTIIQPNWIANSPTALIIAAELLKSGRLLSELHWRQFEKLIATLLEQSGWCVELTKGSKDGGIDVIANKEDPECGNIQSLWQAKKYHPNNKVRLSQVREMSAIRDEQKATKAIIVTTSQLTKGALDWISRDQYRLDYKDKDDIERWVLSSIGL